MSEAALDDLTQRDGIAHAVDARPERDVVEDRLGEGVALLKHHPDPPPDEDRIDVLAVHVVAVEVHATGDAHAADGVVHPVEATKERRLATARRPDEGR